MKILILVSRQISQFQDKGDYNKITVDKQSE